MGLLRWLERKLFTGEVLRDYGTLGELTGVTVPYPKAGFRCRNKECSVSVVLIEVDSTTCRRGEKGATPR